MSGGPSVALHQTLHHMKQSAPQMESDISQITARDQHQTQTHTIVAITIADGIVVAVVRDNGCNHICREGQSKKSTRHKLGLLHRYSEKISQAIARNAVPLSTFLRTALLDPRRRRLLLPLPSPLASPLSSPHQYDPSSLPVPSTSVALWEALENERLCLFRRDSGFPRPEINDIESVLSSSSFRRVELLWRDDPLL